ncbi:MAG: manganese catalase family protein [Acidobacteriaceae bacterium]|nr:manganese catalase family protein [Acidobacteriaceae bacterium]MBV8569054.1 manganese catalase family protein [Acidobacteriaceae bacterium]
MFIHKKELLVPVTVNTPDPRFGQFLLEQFGGATGELTACLQYFVQSFHVENPGLKDMLLDISTEEIGHLEMVGKLIELHTVGEAKIKAEESPLFAMRGKGPHFLDSMGSAWTAKYINEGGDVVRDLRADIAAEAGARQTYEELIKRTTDDGTKKALVHLLTREIAHTKMFMEALASLGKLTDAYFGSIPPDDTVQIYYNMSSNGTDVRGPWNSEPAFKYVADPLSHDRSASKPGIERPDLAGVNSVDVKAAATKAP